MDRLGRKIEADYLDVIIDRISKTAEREKAEVKGIYQAKKGDSWWSITTAHSPGRTPEENAALNNMTIKDIIKPCDDLTIWTTPGYSGESDNPNCPDSAIEASRL